MASTSTAAQGEPENAPPVDVSQLCFNLTHCATSYKHYAFQLASKIAPKRYNDAFLEHSEEHLNALRKQNQQQLSTEEIFTSCRNIFTEMESCQAELQARLNNGRRETPPPAQQDVNSIIKSFLTQMLPAKHGIPTDLAQALLILCNFLNARQILLPKNVIDGYMNLVSQVPISDLPSRPQEAVQSPSNVFSDFIANELTLNAMKKNEELQKLIDSQKKESRRFQDSARIKKMKLEAQIEDLEEKLKFAEQHFHGELQETCFSGETCLETGILGYRGKFPSAPSEAEKMLKEMSRTTNDAKKLILMNSRVVEGSANLMKKWKTAMKIAGEAPQTSYQESFAHNFENSEPLFSTPITASTTAEEPPQVFSFHSRQQPSSLASTASDTGNLDRPRFSGSDLTFEIKKLNDEISGLRQENEELRASNEYLRTAHGVDVHNISQLQLQIKATQELNQA
ncbi:Rho-GAP domain-containing protein [Caenorhabditis elegans]|uniref:Rho-GAP domain-containing protein n=1 Tax=Caenorhabditis elegans TaxID=6239 RepID=O17118_CAEEL|nr:Rho-GAP domain-containing protein [Caenorhabditis elegans]CCD69707.2 Rho-GAP domain-containing protein [Caenorhabditis elegans]|eukprot:NP_494599.2 Uncharacterized protein CELE_M151.3 [Caenorhabditis elegans]